MSYQTLLLSQERGVWQITLNRPAVRNAMSLQMVGELLQVLEQAQQDASARVLVMRGAGGHFCAGGDIQDMAMARMRLEAAAQANQPDPVAEVSAAFGKMCTAFASTGLATIAVLQGTVMGGGFGLACVADVVLGDASASLRLPETSLGIVPAQIAPLLVQRLGYSQAMRLAVTGARLNAQQALSLGLLHELHSAASLDEALQQQITQILSCAPQAIAHSKALISKARFTPAAQLVQEAAEVFSRAVQSDEGTEGTTAFLQKRKPKWATP